MSNEDPNLYSPMGATGKGGKGAGGRSAGRGIFTTSIAVLALVVALASALFSWRAIDQANDARDIAKAGSAGLAAPVTDTTTPVGPTADPSSAATPTTDVPPDPGATGDVPVLNAQTQYSVKYSAEPMTIPSGCNDYVYLDLDEPRVKVDQGEAEVRYYDPCGNDPATLELLDQVKGSEAPAATTTPADCAERIRASPLGNGKQPVRAGRVLCITTSLSEARTRGDTWKMVVLSVAATGQDGTVSVKANAWNIPA